MKLIFFPDFLEKYITYTMDFILYKLENEGVNDWTWNYCNNKLCRNETLDRWARGNYGDPLAWIVNYILKDNVKYVTIIITSNKFVVRATTFYESHLDICSSALEVSDEYGTFEMLLKVEFSDVEREGFERKYISDRL